jgi:(p)ppGpp synthase/HD superfamily hydrolase
MKKLLRSYIKSVLQEICGGNPQDVEDAFQTAELAHLGQTRRASGDPYMTHPLEVARIIRRYYPEEDNLCLAAILHDTLEDAAKQGNVKSPEEMRELIQQSFGDEKKGDAVLSIVIDLTHVEPSDYAQYFASLLNKPNALIVKLADMLHNLTDAPSQHQALKYKNALEMLEEKPEFISSAHWFALHNAIDAVINSEQ